MIRNWTCVLAALLFLALAASPGAYAEELTLEGAAEDLWGNRVELGDYDNGVVLIHPFSPANCGYCLVDGDFIRENYCLNTEERGGKFFGMCLFNPQLDVYSYLKHYRDEFPVLTAPVSLHRYHRNGFPWMSAFKDGKSVYRGVIAPYEEIFGSLSETLWGEDRATLTPTSPRRIAEVITEENESLLGLYVFPDGDTADYEQVLRELDERVKRTGKRPLAVRYEGQLTDDDLQKNLFLRGQTERFSFAFLEGKDTPIEVTPDSIRIGSHAFPAATTTLSACFPNPLNPKRYMILELYGRESKRLTYNNWLDYRISTTSPEHGAQVQLYGMFGKKGCEWTFDERLAFGPAAAAGCADGVCPAPPSPSQALPSEGGKDPVALTAAKAEAAERGRTWTLGASACRFPSLALDNNGTCWVAWEENGDIVVAALSDEGSRKPFYAESGPSDSFNPVLAFDGNRLWCFYLNDSDGFYRLYARHYDGRVLSDAILLSRREPLDVITPAAASNGDGKVVVAWSEWRGNRRFLMYRTIERMTPGEIQQAAVAPAGISYSYTNAWYPSLAFDGGGTVWGAWNQHYPALLGVCAGNLAEEATSVTRLTGNSSTNERGGYPSALTDAAGRKWVFWESFGWDTAGGKPQKLLGSCYDEKKGAWSLPATISFYTLTTRNQTPRAAVDDKGNVWVASSGRKDDTEPWGVYMVRFKDGKCTTPELISARDENARAPVIAAGADGMLWVAWHSGRGAGMKVKVLGYQPDDSQSVAWREAPASELSADGKALVSLEASAVRDARAFLQACANENWEAASHFYGATLSGKMKKMYAGLEIIHIGEPFRREGHAAWFVPYEIRLSSGETIKHNLALQRTSREHFVVDGGV